MPPVLVNARSSIRRPAFQDCSLLALVTALSAAFYVSRLGFYSDDWNFLWIFWFSADQSLTGLMHAFFAADPNTRARPLQALYDALLYKLFGLNPVGFHIVNAGVFILGLCAFYFVLGSHTERRMMALAVPLLY